MRAIWTACLAGWIAITPVRAQFDPAKLIPEVMRYRMISGAVEVGSSTVTITRDDAAGVLQIFESISGLFEQTAVITLRDDTSLRPLTTYVVISRDNQYHELKLQYSDNGQRVTGEVRRPPEFGGARLIGLSLSDGATDVYAAPYLFRAATLVIGKTVQFPLFNALQNEKGVARAWVSKIEVVSVPAGNFECFRLEAFLGTSRLILNVEQQFPHRIIRQILPELEVKFELVKE